MCTLALSLCCYSKLGYSLLEKDSPSIDIEQLGWNFSSEQVVFQFKHCQLCQVLYGWWDSTYQLVAQA